MIEQTTRRVVEVPAQRWENEGGAPANKTVSAEDAALERVRARAFSIYTARIQAGEAGDAVSDWERAERETAAQFVASTPARPSVAERPSVAREAMPKVARSV